MRARKLICGLLAIAMSLSAFPAVVSHAEGSTYDPAAGSWKFDFGGGTVEDGYIGVSADKAFTDDLEYGFVGITDKDYKFKNGSYMDSFVTVQGQRIELANGTNGSSGVNGDFVASVKGSAISEPADFYDYTTANPIRFSMAAENGGYYHVRVTLANSSTTEPAKVSLFAERRHQMLTDAVIATGGTLDYEFNVDVESVYFKSLGAAFGDDSISIEITGVNAAIASMEVTKLETGTTLWLMGDSTGCDQNCNFPYFPNQNYAGTGQGLTKYLPANIALSNQGDGGINSGDKNHYKQVKLKAGDYLYAEWGHNETSTENYISNMEKYYVDTVKAGAKFIVVGPIDRSSSSQFDSATGKWSSTLGSYSAAGEAFVNRVLTDSSYVQSLLGSDYSKYTPDQLDNIAFVDINAGWIEFMNEATTRYETVTNKAKDFQSVKYYFKSDKSGLVENSHENDMGADNAAYIFFTEAQKKVDAANDANATDAVKAQAAVLEGLVTDMRKNTPAVVSEVVMKGGNVINKALTNVYYPPVVAASHDGYASAVKKVNIEDNKITSVTVKMNYYTDLTVKGITYALVVADVNGTQTSTALDTKYDVTNGNGTFTLTFAEPVTLGSNGTYTVWLQGLNDDTQAVFAEDEYRFSEKFTQSDVSDVDEYLIGDYDDIEIPDTFAYFGVKTGSSISGQNGWTAYPAGNANSSLAEDAENVNYPTYLNISKTTKDTYYLYKPFTSSVSDGIIVFDADIYYGSGNIQFYYSNNGRNRNEENQFVDLFKISNNKLTANGNTISLDITQNTWTHITASLDYGTGTITVKCGNNAEQTFAVDKLRTDIISEYMPVNLSNLAIYTGVEGEMRLANVAVKKLTEPVVYKTVAAAANDASMGTVTVNGTAVTAQVERGKPTVFKATPNDGYEFVNWTDEKGNVVSASATYTYEKTYVNASLTANFESTYSEGYTVTRINDFTDDFEGETNIFGVTNKAIFDTNNKIPRELSIVSTENIENSVFGKVLSISRDAFDETATLETAVTLGEDDFVTMSLDMFNGLFINGTEAKKEYTFAVLDNSGSELISFKYYDLTTEITDVKIGGSTAEGFEKFVYSKTTPDTRGFGNFDFTDENYPGKVKIRIEGNGETSVTFAGYNLSGAKTFSGTLNNGTVTVKSIKINKDAEENRYPYHSSAIDNIVTKLITAPEKHRLVFTATDISTDLEVTPTITVKDKSNETVADLTKLYGTYTYTAELEGYQTVTGTVTVTDEDKTINLEIVPSNQSVVYLKDTAGNVLDIKTGSGNVVYYPVIVEKDGVYYKTEANTAKQNGTVYNFGKYFSAPGTADITYSVLENCVYYAEGEALITDTNSSSDSTVSTHSMGGAKLAIKETSNFTIPALPVGKYMVVAAARANGDGNEHIYIKPLGSSNTDRADLVYYGNNGYRLSSFDMIVKKADKQIDVTYATGSRIYLDYIYIVKIPQPEFSATVVSGSLVTDTAEDGSTASGFFVTVTATEGGALSKLGLKIGETDKGEKALGTNIDLETGASVVFGIILDEIIGKISDITMTAN